MIPVTCPKCGHKFEIRRRAQGLGTRVDLTKPPGAKEREIIKVLQMMPAETSPYSIREIQSFIFAKGIRREKPGAKAFNFHYIQEALSKNVFRGSVRAERRGKHFSYSLILQTAPAPQTTL